MASGSRLKLVMASPNSIWVEDHANVPDQNDDNNHFPLGSSDPL